MALRLLTAQQYETTDLGTGALVDRVKLYVDEAGNVLALTYDEAASLEGDSE